MPLCHIYPREEIRIRNRVLCQDMVLKSRQRPCITSGSAQSRDKNKKRVSYICARFFRVSLYYIIFTQLQQSLTITSPAFYHFPFTLPVAATHHGNSNNAFKAGMNQLPRTIP